MDQVCLGSWNLFSTPVMVLGVKYIYDQLRRGPKFKNKKKKIDTMICMLPDFRCGSALIQ